MTGDSMDEVSDLYRHLADRAGRYGITVREAALSDDVPGQFDGPTITLNQDYDATERAFYLTHSIGSIAEWSIHLERSHAVFNELARAKRRASDDPARLQRALAAYEAFETATWNFALWLMEDLGYQRFVAEFTTFGRADLEAMRIFHATGQAPVWKDFYAAFKQELRDGKRSVEPFIQQRIPDFQAIRIPEQEIVQEDDN